MSFRHGPSLRHRFLPVWVALAGMAAMALAAVGLSVWMSSG
jgi:hypothetical protein